MPIDWSKWEPWKKMWEDWHRIGRENVALSHIQLVDLYNFFCREVKARALDPMAFDVSAFLDPRLTYRENKSILAELLGAPPKPEEYEAMYEEYKGELESIVKEQYPEVWKVWEERIERLERETERLPKVEREKERYKKLAEDLQYRLQQTIREMEELKRKARVPPRKYRVLKDFDWGIMHYKAGDIVTTEDYEWGEGLVESGYFEPVVVPVVPVAPPPPPPPKPPVKVPPPPPPKVLPPIPEKCLVDGTPIRQVTRVPIGPIPIRLPAEEEYERARLGIPIPEKELVWMDVPVTMKVWICEQDHMFERDAAGRLVQRTPEYLYRKIIRERAKLERIVYPPVAPPVRVYPPAPPIPPRRVKLQDVFWSWLERTKGLSREAFVKLSELEKGRIREEFGSWYAATLGY